MLATATVAFGVVYAVRGPNFILDDWFTLAWRRDGLWSTGGWDQLRARPGAWLVFTAEYGLLGPHPLVIYLVQLALNVTVVVMLHRVLMRFVGAGIAFAAAAAWVLLPIHSTLDYWLAVMPAVVALLLLLAGVRLAQTAADDGRAPAGAIALFVAASLTYEAVLPAAAVMLVVTPLLCGARIRWRPTIIGEALLAATGTWMLVHTQHKASATPFPFGEMLPANFGWGITPRHGIGVVVGLFAAVLMVVAVARLALPGFRHLAGAGDRLVAAGWAVIVVGVIAFARADINPVALGDRVNVVAGIGAALAWIGIVRMLWAWRPLAVAVVLVVGGLAVTTRLQRIADYDRAGDDATRIIDAVLERYPEPPPSVVQIGPRAVYHHGVVGLVGTIEPALIARTGDARYRANVSQSMAEFRTSPPAYRVEIRDIFHAGS